jgi:hypothetical protein
MLKSCESVKSCLPVGKYSGIGPGYQHRAEDKVGPAECVFVFEITGLTKGNAAAG